MAKNKTFRKKATSYLALAVLGILAACIFSSDCANALVSKPSGKSSDLEIKIESTAARLTAGSITGITVEITNTSDKVVCLYERCMTITIPPEFTSNPEKIQYWYVLFSTEHPGPKGEPSVASIKIPPGNSYKAISSISEPSPEPPPANSFWGKGLGRILAWILAPIRSFNIVKTLIKEMHFIFFVPGDYTLNVIAKYWIPPEEPPNGNYHTIVASRIVTVDAPQSVILFGAMLGGLISYFLLPQARRRLVVSQKSSAEKAPSMFNKGLREVLGFLGAALLSIIVAILLARISETQFLIKVTVADLWGAIAIGFVGNYAGVELLNKIIDRYLNRQAAQNKVNGNVSGS